MTFNRAGTKTPRIWNYRCNILLSLWRFNRQRKWTSPTELSSIRLNGSCLGSCCTLCCNSFFVPWQYLNFMSQQATIGSLCWAKQCLIGFWSMATPPEACFHPLFQQHLERNGGDYIPPVVSRWIIPRKPLEIFYRQSRSMLPCCPVQLLANPKLLLPLIQMSIINYIAVDNCCTKWVKALQRTLWWGLISFFNWSYITFASLGREAGLLMYWSETKNAGTEASQGENTYQQGSWFHHTTGALLIQWMPSPPLPSPSVWCLAG